MKSLWSTETIKNTAIFEYTTDIFNPTSNGKKESLSPWRKKEKPLKRLVAGGYAIENALRHVLLVGLISKINEQNIRIHLKKIKRLLKSKEQMNDLFIAIKLVLRPMDNLGKGPRTCLPIDRLLCHHPVMICGWLRAASPSQSSWDAQMPPCIYK